jgi:type I restriction enzyme, S subunit
VRTDWSVASLAEVCQIKPPKSEAKRRLKDSDLVSFVPMENLGIDQKYFEPVLRRTLGEVSGSYTYFADGDVLMAKITPCFENGKLGIAKNLTGQVGFGSSEYIVLRPGDKLNNQFLYYYLLQDSFRDAGIQTMSGAVGHKRVSKEFVERLQIPLPLLAEQRRIVAILDEAFAGLATATANAEKNLRNARELLESTLRSSMSATEEGWFETTIGDQITLQRGFDITKKVQRPGQVPVVSSGGIKSFHDTALAAAPGVVIGRKGSLGTVFYLEEKFWPHDTTLWVKDFKGNDQKFVYYFFKQLDVVQLDSGTANPALNRNLVHPLRVAWPSVLQQKAIVERIDSVSDSIRDLNSLNLKKASSIAELKQSVLQKAFTGELSLKSISIVNEAAE